MKFRTAEFLSEAGHVLKPIGLSWFQAEWDDSVSNTAQNFGESRN